MLDNIRKLLDEALGFVDRPLPRPARAAALLNKGRAPEDIGKTFENHNRLLDELRDRGAVQRLCGERWTRHGNNSRTYISKSDCIRGDRILTGGASAFCSDSDAGIY